MAIHDFSSERLYVAVDLAAGCEFELGADQAHYLANVLRLGAGSHVLVFNGRDGEWRARLVTLKKRAVTLAAEAQVRGQTAGPDLVYLFAPLKHARLDYMVQKAVEMGVARLGPVLTRRTVAQRVNLDRMRANVIEAAEQCGVLRLPEVSEPVDLERAIAGWDASRVLVFCDEAAAKSGPLEVLAAVKPAPVGVLVGPEGGFDARERDLLLAQSFVVPVSLGPRIIRADTAAVAVLALVNATLGDWKADD